MYLVFLLTRVNVFLPQTVKQTLTECLHCFISGFPTALPIILISFTATHYKDWLGLKCAGGTTSTQLFHLNNCLAQNRSFISFEYRPTVLNTCTTLIIIPQTRLSNQVKSSHFYLFSTFKNNRSWPKVLTSRGRWINNTSVQEWKEWGVWVQSST